MEYMHIGINIWNKKKKKQKKQTLLILIQFEYPLSEIPKSEKPPKSEIFAGADMTCHKWKISENIGKIPRWYAAVVNDLICPGWGFPSQAT